MSDTIKNFIKTAKDKHGDKYDYSLVDFKVQRDNIKIICPIHGEFISNPRSHLNSKYGCKQCIGKSKHTNESFIKTAKDKHGDKYDYSLVDYRGNKTKVDIICPIHGVFKQKPNCHLNGDGCILCGYISNKYIKTSNTNEFVKKSKYIHNDKYDYSLVDYKGNKIDVDIICPTHGVFSQLPNGHLNGAGCPKCGNQLSSQHEYIKDYLIRNNIKFKENTKRIISPLELDFYLPDYKIAIEINGIYWHSELAGKDKNYHLNKTKQCQDKGIQLIHINENEFINKNKIVYSKLNSILNNNKKHRIHGRKCEVREIDTKLKSKFLNKYHLQGNDKASVKLGLFYNNRLVSVMTFCKRRVALGKKSSKEGEYELSRFCGNFNFYTIGGASKLLKYFERNYNPSKIVTYADKRWSKGDVYFKLGFIHTHDSKPNYWYFYKNDKYNIKHRFSYRKSELNKKLNIFDVNKSEWENMKDNGWNRIWDCGNMVFETE